MPRLNYTMINWENAPSTKTPITAENLDHMDNGLAALYADVGELDSGLAELKQRLDNLSQQDASQMSVTFGEPGDTGVSDDLPLQTSPSTLRNIITSIHAQIRALAARTTPHIGMIIESTTLSTEAEVIAVYGGDHWIQHKGYFLYGDDTGVTANSATADGGEATHTLTVEEMPSHRHSVSSGWEDAAGVDRLVYSAKNGSYQDYGIGAVNFIENTGGGQAHNNMPPYKKVYIWECVSDDGPTL